ncbi:MULTISPECIES: class I SAM-dependent methyltransferase [Bradyrhizobium]|uniref:class I SAM-dependent methyltransferase n=1 Tax=Bradyrhizobium TaxID=374 RepID=UPI00293F6925|nr:class I SAM-dependent methyltransferase [Bradyrhizobium sp. NDS-1]WOH72958.1 class I SAM-dependent methyltransferase [Bradyrhizobium sp. NDS-1]
MPGSWSSVLSLLEEQRFTDVVAHLDATLRSQPTNIEALLLRSIARASIGLTQEAEADLWRALVVNPAAPGVRTALGDRFVRNPAAQLDGHDLSLDSGERQTAHEVGAVRRDHTARYEFAARWLGRHLTVPQAASGLDLFCGNGYGARIIADRCGARVIGIDGSAPAVTLAERSYGDHRVVFTQAYFPFELAAASADFAVCFESIEHVTECDEFLRQAGKATAGPILLSCPLESGLPFALHKSSFRFHVRHFTIEEIEDKLWRLAGRRIAEIRGQMVYRLEAGRLAGLLAPAQMELSRLNGDSQFAIVAAV